MAENKWLESGKDISFNKKVTKLADETSKLVKELVNVRLEDLKGLAQKASNNTKDDRIKKIEKLINEIQVGHKKWESKT